MAALNPQQQSPSPFEKGVFLPNGHHTDPPKAEDDPTVGFKLNHFMMRIRDPKRSLNFYIELMGMRTIYTMNTGPLTIYYLGYPQTEQHRADPAKFGVDTCINLRHTLGLLELYHIHGSENQDEGYYSTGNTPPNLGFGHLGFTVPDVPAALKRLEDAGVPVVKPLQVSTRESIFLSEWQEDQGVGVGALHDNYKAMLNKCAFVSDPDGYIVELVPQKENPLKT